MNHPDTIEEFKLTSSASYLQVQEYYRNHGFLQPSTAKEKPKPRCRCVATQPNALWRSDLHDCKNFPGYLMIILDDCSRFVVAWGHFDTKESLNTAAVLSLALRRYGPIAFFFTDNGTEFKGDLKAVLKKMISGDCLPILGILSKMARLKDFGHYLRNHARCLIKLKNSLRDTTRWFIWDWSQSILITQLQLKFIDQSLIGNLKKQQSGLLMEFLKKSQSIASKASILKSNFLF